MALRIGVSKERMAGERRVALVPEVVARLSKQGWEVLVERGAGELSYFPDSAYAEAGAQLADADGVSQAEVIVGVQPPEAAQIARLRRGQLLISFLHVHRNGEAVTALRDAGVTSFAMERIPRITRAQAMDVLSSQATVSGYRAALMAADLSPSFFPMLTTAAGTIRPARVLVLGAGVAGLQAIATARRLGAVVEAYDVRRAAREQVESLGAKFLQVEMDAEAEGGYARELTAEEKEREQVLLRKSIAQADVVITTAQIPGRPAPQLIATSTVHDMKPGSVIIDIAAETGGNCEATRPGERIEIDGVSVYGPLHVPSQLPVHASVMYAKNMQNFLGLLRGEDGSLRVDWNDEILASSVVTHDGAIPVEAVRAAIGGTGS
ncbi:MAG: Re/Si-specific NAD(P)(+) transhydrogenase subunit alpha [Gammaproteobacteria bacterium]|jgi:NAD(P) transhydrogenase subunit alpha|nr:Re/Si-specific NAD(P)(+) transhydrogenase subunit alpha [Gammaproteobacteria bacterium]